MRENREEGPQVQRGSERVAEQIRGPKPPSFVLARGHLMPAANDTGGTHAPFDYP